MATGRHGQPDGSQRPHATAATRSNCPPRGGDSRTRYTRTPPEGTGAAAAAAAARSSLLGAPVGKRAGSTGESKGCQPRNTGGKQRGAPSAGAP
ncbi:hypothetical protein HPB50_005539 [Hyalomma asiaticum]|uniref:Uncharacterized protein n=1 Tax=Hyalomma asiaticum TaxID=266040 RepID=A0ACB7SJR9_HYAAI|nr:hypothetical protein HPB50_005539 [Hyalomma asiaticum]